MELIIEEAWHIFINQFIHQKYRIGKEAPFHLHFANVLKLVGDLYCLKREEIFLVDLERTFKVNGKNRSLDIFCELLSLTRKIAKYKYRLN